MIGVAKHAGTGNSANINDPYAGFARIWADAASPLTQIGERVGPVGSPTLAWRTFGVSWYSPGQRLYSSFAWQRYSSAIFMPVSIPVVRGVNSWLPFTLVAASYGASYSKGVIGTARFFQDPITYTAEHWEATSFSGSEPIPYSSSFSALSLCFLFKADNTFKIVSSKPAYSDNLSITVPDIGMPVFFGLKITPIVYKETFSLDYRKNEPRRSTWAEVPLDAKLHGSV